MRQISICVSSISVLTVRKLQEKLLFCFAPFSNLPSSVTTSSSSSIMNSVQNKNTLSGVLSWRTNDFVRCIRSPIIQTFQRNRFSLFFLDIQTYPPLSPINTGFICIKVSMKSLFVVETFSTVMLSLLFLAFEYWFSNIPKNATSNVSTLYWNS